MSRTLDRDRGLAAYTEGFGETSVNESIQHLVAASHRLAQGDFTVRVEPSGNQALDQLGQAFNQMAEQLQQDRAQLQKEQEWLRSLISNAAGVIYRCSADPDWKLLFINDAIEEISGYPAVDFMNHRVRTLSSIIHPEDQQRVERSIQRCLAEERPYKLEYRILRADGSVCWLYDKGWGVFDEEGNLLYFNGVLFDITDHKQGESELKQSLQELKQAQSHLIQTEKMSSLGQLVAGVAHEINNPINFIYGNVRHANGYIEDLLHLIRLYQQHYPNYNSEIQAYQGQIDLEFVAEDLPKILSSMRIGAERIRQIVLSLRNFSRLDEAEMKPVDIHEGLNSTLLILQSRLKSKPDRPEIRVIKNYGRLPMVYCYAGQLNQVFMNVLSNAIDALESYDRERSPQEIQLYPATITICTEGLDNGRVLIRIADNGPGIPESAQPRLFDPFFTTKPVGQGTGLGLAISYQIVVEKHKGALWFTSGPNNGSEFYIEIPVHQEAGMSQLIAQLSS